MEILLAWGAYLALSVLCLALGWAWLGPRLPRRLRLAILWLVAGLSVLAMAFTAYLPQDYRHYRPDDLAEYWRGVAALFAGLFSAIAGTAAALSAIGRRRTQNAALFGVGVYLAGVGLVLYWMLDGQATLHAPALLVVGATVAVAAALRLVGLQRWLARASGLATGLMVVLVGEALRGMGGRGGGPDLASREMQSLAVIMLLLFIVGVARLLRSQGQVVAGPLLCAATGLAGTALVLVLRGPGEWAPSPDAASTTLYGLPLTLLVVTVSLIMLEWSPEVGHAPRRPARASLWRLAPSRASSGGGRKVPIWPAWPLVGGLLALAGTIAVWHPAPELCTSLPYTDSSSPAPARLAWASSPDPASPRGAPDVAAFAQQCTHRTPGVTQAVYAYYPRCKWAEVDRRYPLVQASGTVRAIDLSHGDSPWLHITHDLQLDVEVDQASAWLVLGEGRPGSLLHVEAEAGAFPVDYRPTAGDRVTIAGRWIYDCGHDPKTEIHPAAVVASEHDEWRADFAGGPQPQHVRVLRVWMNSEPGVVHVPLAPIDLRVRFPPRQTGIGQGAIPVVEVVSGEPSAVRWTISTGAEVVPEPVAALHIVPPGRDGSAAFELLFGYRVTAALPPPNPPISYSVAFDRLVVHDDLRRKSRNTTGIPTDLLAPQLGFPGSGNWIMQAIVGHAWRVLLDDAPVRSGHTYSLAAVPPVPLFAPGEEHLRMAITGYAENDPSNGVQLASASIGTSEEAVELASGSIDQTAVLKWDAGRLADLCCGTLQSFKPAHGAWTLYYHVTRATP